VGLLVSQTLTESVGLWPAKFRIARRHPPAIEPERKASIGGGIGENSDEREGDGAGQRVGASSGRGVNPKNETAS
jgi:hypothetical protein